MPDVQPTQDVLQLGRDTYNTVSQALREAGAPLVIAAVIAGFCAGVVMSGNALLAILLAAVRWAGIPFAVAVLQLIDTVRKDNPEGLAQVTTGAMSEFLGFEITADDIPTGKDPKAIVARMQVLGGKLHDQLISEFVPNGTVTPESGEKAARAFSGFNMNFSTASALISILGEMVSLGNVKQIRELGVELATNLGLGRMHRAAMRPLVDNTIAKPYDRLLRKRYRQDAISEAQFVKAYNRGKLTLAQVQDHFAQKGYPDDQITELIHQLTSHLSDTEVNLLLRYGAIDEATAVQMLVDEGWPDATARTKLKVLQTQKLDTLEGQYVNAWETICVDRRIDDQTFLDGLNVTHLTDAEKEWERRYISIKRENPHTDPTLAEMQAFYAAGIITLDDWDQFLKRKGYDAPDRFGSPDVQFWLTLELLKKTADANAKAAKGKVKLLTFAQLKKAYAGDTITQQQLQDYLAGEGYTPADVFRLMAQLLGRVGTPAAQQAAADLRAQADAADLAPDNGAAS